MKMKYSIMHDWESDEYYIADRSAEHIVESKVYESDSLHNCFRWAFANGKRLYSDLQNEEVWCVYWSDFDENYYVSPDKGDSTLDDVCFRGSEEECDEFFRGHFIAEDNFESDDSYYPCDYE